MLIYYLRMLFFVCTTVIDCTNKTGGAFGKQNILLPYEHNTIISMHTDTRAHSIILHVRVYWRPLLNQETLSSLTYTMHENKFGHIRNEERKMSKTGEKCEVEREQWGRVEESLSPTSCKGQNRATLGSYITA